MVRYAWIPLLLVALVGCDSQSPSEPWRDEFDKYFVQVKVYNEDSTRPIPGARGTVEDLFTLQKEQWRADDAGESERILWEADPRIASLRVIVEPGTLGGVSYDKFDKTLVPRCVKDGGNSKWGICRLNVELVDDGIGR